jgi:NADH:ubiquinone oxidoreductase subunit 6 (subunit J)
MQISDITYILLIILLYFFYAMSTTNNTMKVVLYLYGLIFITGLIYFCINIDLLGVLYYIIYAGAIAVFILFIALLCRIKYYYNIDLSTMSPAHLRELDKYANQIFHRDYYQSLFLQN